MRSASVLVVTLRGLATEVCKNIVLAGIGRLTVLDDKDVSEEDLGCGFFFREENVGTKVSRHTSSSCIHAVMKEADRERLMLCGTC
jgi:molybdopterin/thiamine biosynthesis adenylyltransferase